MSNVPEGYMRSIAGSLLAEKEEKEKKDAKKSKKSA